MSIDTGSSDSSGVVIVVILVGLFYFQSNSRIDGFSYINDI